VVTIYEEMLAILEVDARNESLRHKIKKLQGNQEQEGQWRIRVGIYRLRYDVEDDKVMLRSINHRKDAY
jgi:mRNA-degrading endonuclease RelE of RelBE toxin-antitoxin system